MNSTMLPSRPFRYACWNDTAPISSDPLCGATAGPTNAQPPVRQVQAGQLPKSQQVLVKGFAF
jgi:hypothetical protein